MRQLHRGLVLLSLVFLLAGLALFVYAAPLPGSGSPERLFRNIVQSGKNVAPRASKAEARVEINFNALARAGALRIDLLDGTHVAALRTGFERRSPDDYTWRGRLIGPGEKGGDIVLTAKDGAVAGIIFTARGVYRLIPRAGGEHRLALTNPEAFPACDGGVEPSAGTPLASAVETVQPFADSAERLDVLAVYTPTARAEAGGTAALEATIRNAIDLTHTAYANSQVVPRLNLVHMQEIDHREAKHFSTDLFWVRDDPQVNAMRDQYGADMVSLVVHNLSACGIGFLMSEPSVSFAPNAYQVTAWDCAGANLTMPHEFGHIQGADHNPEDASGYPTGAAYRWSYGHYIDGNYRTVMSYSTPCSISCPRHPYFSNPNVIFNGAPTGVAGDRENYRTINDTAIYVANFRPTATSCGNGLLDGTEECDGVNLNGASCSTFGHQQGTLSCTSGCTIDASNCSTCGNGLREGGETCDGADVAGLSCADFGCTGAGSLGCSAVCDGFDLSGCSGCPVCDHDGICEFGESCAGCADCLSAPGAQCGDGLCNIQAGEDCLSCAIDCNGVQIGKASGRFCCGYGGQNPVGCSDPRCNEGGFSCSAQATGPSCCGDLTCTGVENSCNCALDCGPPQSLELSCSNGVDDDCDTTIDCADAADCAGDPACLTCQPLGTPCTSAGECCSGLCKGKRTKVCS